MPLFASAHTLVEAHFAGTTTAAADRRLWGHLRRCEDCRARYRTRSLLEALDPDGGERARRRMGRALFAQRGRVGSWLGAGAALAAAAAAVILVVAPRPRGDGDDSAAFRARGPAGATADAAGPGIALYRVRGGSAPVRAGAVVQAGDALAFSYTNPPSPAAATHVMIFGVDGTGRVYWFWPAWNAAGADPTALPIRPSDTPVELAEAVRHPLAPGPLTIHALFARRPHHVREVEAAVAGGKEDLAALGGVLVSETLEVLP